jgi:CubicO group peptidase (beta-lactamase class C family)
MGATDPAYWGLDAPVEEGGIERSFAQYYATTRDYARFGALLLDTGKWQGTPLVPQDYTARLLTPIHTLAPECDAKHYGYQIWLGNTEDGLAFSAMEGHRGQFVISVPALDLVVVRTGYDKAPDKLRHLPGHVYRCIAAAREVIGS